MSIRLPFRGLAETCFVQESSTPRTPVIGMAKTLKLMKVLSICYKIRIIQYTKSYLKSVKHHASISSLKNDPVR